LLQWLDDILQRFLDLIPQPALILPNAGGVRCNMWPWKTWHSTLGPGFYLIWPLFQQIIWVEVTPQVVDLRPQSVLTAGGRSLVVSGAVRYRVTDVKKAILDVQDYDASIVALALGTIAATVSGAGTHSLPDLQKQVRDALAKESSGWGLKIEQVYITDLDKCRSLRLLQNQ